MASTWPAGYDFLEAGIQRLSAKATQLCIEKGQPYYVVMEKRPEEEYADRLGAFYPQAAAAAARQHYGRRRLQEEQQEEQRQHHERICGLAKSFVANLYPAMPEHLQEKVSQSLPYHTAEADVQVETVRAAQRQTQEWLARSYEAAGQGCFTACERARYETEARLREWKRWPGKVRLVPIESCLLRGRRPGLWPQGRRSPSQLSLGGTCGKRKLVQWGLLAGFGSMIVPSMRTTKLRNGGAPAIPPNDGG